MNLTQRKPIFVQNISKKRIMIILSLAAPALSWCHAEPKYEEGCSLIWKISLALWRLVLRQEGFCFMPDWKKTRAKYVWRSSMIARSILEGVRRNEACARLVAPVSRNPWRTRESRRTYVTGETGPKRSTKWRNEPKR